MIRKKRIQKPIVWLALLAVIIGGMVGAWPAVLCIGANGHVAIEILRVTTLADTGALVAVDGCAGPCVDFTLNISNQKEELLYPALTVPPEPTVPVAVIVSAATLWGGTDRGERSQPWPYTEAPPPLLSLYTVVLLT